VKTSKHLRKLYVLALVVFGMIGNAGATSANTDVSDIWWKPTESGWGMQMVNTGTFVFATIYVYGPGGNPTWYTGQLDKTGAAQTTYSGPLFATTGPYFGGSFNPDAVNGRQVGTMTFVLTTVTSGQLTYSVDGVVVVKSVERQPLRLDDYNGSYSAVATTTVAGCGNATDNGNFTSALTIDILQNGSAMTVTAKYADSSSCVYSGTYSQLGRMGQVSGTYACTWGEIGTATIFEMSNVPFMFTARLQSQSTNTGCTEAAEFAGVIPR
jgi:hypothetical protein